MISHRSLFWPALLVSTVLTGAEAQVPDRSSDLHWIGNPYTAAGYTGTNQHRTLRDIRYHFGRVYVGYGHSNNGNANRFLYADPVNMAVGAETPANFTITEEEQTHFRVFDDTLYLISYDHTTGAQYYTRSPAGVWSKVTVNGGVDHARDLHLHGERVWYSNNNGTTTSPYPNLTAAPIAAPSGAFVRQSQPEPAGFPFQSSAGYAIDLLPEGFLAYGGRLYTVAPNYVNGEVPFMLRLNNNDYQPWWSVGVPSPASLLDPPYRVSYFASASKHGLTYATAEVWHAGVRRLIFVGDLDSTGTAPSLFQTPDPETTKALPLVLPDQPAGRLEDIHLIKRQGRVFAFTFRTNTARTQTIAQVHQLQPGAEPTLSTSWPALFRFTTPAIIGAATAIHGVPVDYADGVFYFGAGMGYNWDAYTTFDPADLNGSIYKLPFPGVLGPVATPPPELPPDGGLKYLLDNYDDRRANPLTVVSGVTVSVTDGDPDRPGNEGVVTRSTASGSLQFLQNSPGRTSALLRALSASGTSGTLRARVKTFAGENAGAISLRWGIQADTWPDETGLITRRFNAITLPNAATTEAVLEVDLGANPEIAAAAQSYAGGQGTTFRLFIDNGPGPYWSGPVRWVLDDVEIVDLPRPGPPAAAYFLPLLQTPSTVRLHWGDALSTWNGNALGWIVERQNSSTAPWETLALLGSDVETLDVAAGPDPGAANYRLTPYTAFGRGPSRSSGLVTLEAPATPPGNFTAMGLSATQVALSWTVTPYGGVTGIEIARRSAGEGTWSTLATVGADTTAYTDATAGVGTLYDYRVRYLSLVAPSAWSLIRTAGTAADSPPLTLAHWRFNETTGTTAADASGNNLDLNFAGTPAWGPGQVGQAITLAGTGGRGQVADNPLLNGMDKLTVSFWVRPTNLNGGATGNDARFVLSKRSTTTDGVLSVFFYTGNRLFVDLATNNDRFSSNTVFANNTWYHIAVVYDGSLPATQRARLYVNGALDTTASESSASLNTNTAPLVVGMPNAGATNFFDGSLDDMRLIQSAIPAEGITSLMAGLLPSPPPAAGTLARWQADWFAPVVLADPAQESTIWGPSATPAGDGVPNLLKYHLGLDPFAPARADELPVGDLDPTGQFLSLTYWRDRSALETMGIVVWSETLGESGWHTEGVTAELVAQSDTHDQIVAQVPLSGRSRLFLRLEVFPAN